MSILDRVILLRFLKAKGNLIALKFTVFLPREDHPMFSAFKARVAFTGKGVGLVCSHWCIRTPAQGCLKVSPQHVSVGIVKMKKTAFAAIKCVFIS